MHRPGFQYLSQRVLGHRCQQQLNVDTYLKVHKEQFIYLSFLKCWNISIHLSQRDMLFYVAFNNQSRSFHYVLCFIL